MRIQSKSFLLTLKLEHTDPANRMTVEAYGSKFDKLTTQTKIDNAIETVDILTCMPNRVMLVLSGKNQSNNSSIKLLNMRLAGLPIAQNLLTNLTEYKPDNSTETKNSLKEYLNNTSIKTTFWDHNGCVLFDLFNANPFAYHMYIGNKIKI
jgi:hypothetical protein